MFTPQNHVIIFYDSPYFLERQAVTGILHYANTVGKWTVSIQKITDRLSVPDGCGGILVCNPELRQLKKLMQHNLPIVVVSTAKFDKTQKTGLPHVKIDSCEFGNLAAEFFLAHAHRTFVYAGYGNKKLWDTERGEAFVRRMESEGHKVLVYAPPSDAATSAELSVHLREWLKTLPKPLSIFAANDERAREALTACLQLDITVPYEAEILGVDNDEWICESTRPRLSSIPFNSEQGGFDAARVLDAIMHHNEDPSFPAPPTISTISPLPVIERDSTSGRNVGDPIVARALAFIRLNRGLNIRAADVAHALGYTPGWIETRFRESLNASVIDEIASMRLQTILHLIRATSLPPHEIAARCGFTNVSTLCRLVKKKTGKTMTELRWDG